jgi:glutathione S-transferase
VIRVHRIPFSTNVERVAVAAGYKGVEVEWVDHDPADRAAVVALSGQELVPIAELDGVVVRGSMRIVGRLEELRPDPSLLPADPADLARARIFVSWFDRVWKGPPNALDADAEPADAAALRLRCREWTGWCDALLAGSPYLAGERPSIADVCAFPFLKFAVVDPAPGDDERFHAILAELLRSGEHPALDDWVRRMDALPRA